MIILKSKLLREQIKHWTALCALCAWAVSASLWGYAQREKVIVIAVESSGTRLVTDEKDKVLEKELLNFLKGFLVQFYQYDSETFAAHMALATEYMSEDLFREKQAELLKIQENLKDRKLSQSVEIKSIDLIDENTYEASLQISIKERLQIHTAHLKVQMTISEKKRTSTNPYPFELGSLHEKF